MIRVLEYSGDGVARSGVDVRSVEPRGREGGCVWVDFCEPTPDEVALLRDHFGFHPLAVEDCVDHGQQRPKIDLYADYAFIVTSAAADLGEGRDRRVDMTEFDVFLGSSFLVTFHSRELHFVKTAYDRLKEHPEPMAKGPDIVFHSLADALVDEYFPVLDALEEELELLQERLFARPAGAVVNRIFDAKRRLLGLRRVLSPQREVFGQLLRHDFPYLKEHNRVFFADVYDHMLRLFDMVDIHQDLASSSLEAYLSITSNRLNEIMKVLTVITTMLMPLTVITGVYGMNFEFMPELGWRWGYLWALGLMGAASFGMIGYFRRRGWF